MIKIAVSGSNGRMGGSIIRLVEGDPGLELAGGFDIGDDPRPSIEKCDVLIEFTSPEATVRNVGIARELGKAVVVGTTALDKEKIGFMHHCHWELSLDLKGWRGRRSRIDDPGTISLRGRYLRERLGQADSRS